MSANEVPASCMVIASRATSRQMAQPMPWGSHVTLPSASRWATKQSWLSPCPKFSQPQKQGTYESTLGMVGREGVDGPDHLGRPRRRKLHYRQRGEIGRRQGGDGASPRRLIVRRGWELRSSGLGHRGLGGARRRRRLRLWLRPGRLARCRHRPHGNRRRRRDHAEDHAGGLARCLAFSRPASCRLTGVLGNHAAILSSALPGRPRRAAC